MANLTLAPEMKDFVLTRKQQQFILDALASIYSRRLPYEVKFTLIPKEDEQQDDEEM